MKLNPALYKVVQEDTSALENKSDPFERVMSYRDKYQQESAMIRDGVHRAELDHPNSLHNFTTGEKMQVQFPSCSKDPANMRDHMALNGYYDREALSLRNAFKESSGPMPLDTRMMTGARLGSNIYTDNEVYEANQHLLQEI